MEECAHSKIHYIKKASIKVLVAIIPFISLCIMHTHTHIYIYYIYIYIICIHIILPKWAHIIHDLLINYILKNNFLFFLVVPLSLFSLPTTLQESKQY